MSWTLPYEFIRGFFHVNIIYIQNIMIPFEMLHFQTLLKDLMILNYVRV